MNTPQFEVQHWADILDDNNDWKGLLEVGHVRHNTPGNDHISFAILTRVGPKEPGKMSAQVREIVAAKLTASDRERAQFFIDTLDLWEAKLTVPEEEEPAPKANTSTLFKIKLGEGDGRDAIAQMEHPDDPDPFVFAVIYKGEAERQAAWQLVAQANGHQPKPELPPPPPPTERYQLQRDPTDPLKGLIVEAVLDDSSNGIIVAQTLTMGPRAQQLVMFANAGWNNP